jgi:hypothetical protein
MLVVPRGAKRKVEQTLGLLHFVVRGHLKCKSDNIILNGLELQHWRISAIVLRN